MKGILLAAALFCGVMFSLQAQTQADSVKISDKFNQLVLRPFSLADATFILSYERIFPFNHSLRISPFVVLGTGLFRGGLFCIGSRSGFGVDVGYKMFFQDARREKRGNFYIAPYFMYKQLQRTVSFYTNQTVSSVIYVYGAGVDVGVRYVAGSWVTDVTLGLGMRYPVLSNKEYEAPIMMLPSNDDYKGIIPRAQFSFGKAF